MPPQSSGRWRQGSQVSHGGGAVTRAAVDRSGSLWPQAQLRKPTVPKKTAPDKSHQEMEQWERKNVGWEMSCNKSPEEDSGSLYNIDKNKCFSRAQ